MEIKISLMWYPTFFRNINSLIHNELFYFLPALFQRSHHNWISFGNFKIVLNLILIGWMIERHIQQWICLKCWCSRYQKQSDFDNIIINRLLYYQLSRTKFLSRDINSHTPGDDGSIDCNEPYATHSHTIYHNRVTVSKVLNLWRQIAISG